MAYLGIPKYNLVITFLLLYTLLILLFGTKISPIKSPTGYEVNTIGSVRYLASPS